MAELKNQPCYDRSGNFIGWFSRSMAATLIVIAKDKAGKWYVLGSERGQGAADFQGMWNMPCGYLDFNETVAEAACRECYEETGVKVDPDDIVFYGYNDSPDANRQNVTFRFITTFIDKTVEDIAFSKENNEQDEVGKIEWVPLEEYNDRKWAFGHDEIIHGVKDMVEGKTT